MFLISQITRIAKIPALYYRKRRLDLYKKSKNSSENETKPKFSLEDLLGAETKKEKNKNQYYSPASDRKSKKEGTGMNIDLDM